ncbi:molybdopterin binding motif [Gracilibacillus boraciitolerans JCM 21714]|uniref:Putative competence-damage inducible protein n=1 Tax=Gracilibacillus boraciitolerans JCM 21714 TaxID=1298598 RepID=W4VFK5_9BACI|nr:competence/damage-inducible protein A [Gracilibacillus boraciitolerans]GAE91544.1 molybdopterin binding motif [Gracilibacillus boraciitolerans JCM 21714]
MKDIKAEIVSVGTELLLGQIVNTNATWISECLAEQGISVYYHTVVGDNKNRLTTIFSDADKRSDIVFITGGLGPTEDDLTREAFQKLSGLEIIEDEATIIKMEQISAKNNRTMTPNNRKQSHTFKGAMVLKNSVGIAPGIIVDYNNTLWIFMPGVPPREMKAIMMEEVIPYLTRKLKLDAVIHSRMLRFIGIGGESQLEHELQSLISNQTNPTIAPLASEGEVALRLTAKANSLREADKLIDGLENKITAIVGQYLYGYDQVNIGQKVFDLLKEQQLTIASAESLTGGAFAASIVDHQGASEVFNGAAVVYQSFSKAKALNIDEKLLETHGTVSKECAEAMSSQVKLTYQSTIGISFTGVAGPGQFENQEEGTVFISICDQDNSYNTQKFQFHGDRKTVRNRAVKKAYEMVYYQLKRE